MPIIAKKICMVGPFAVGKTSLVRRFVECIFSDKYHTTIGVKISKKAITLDQNALQLMLWDIEGVDVFTELKSSYLRGAAGIMLVLDGTRAPTMNQTDELLGLVRQHLPDVPIVVLVNKSDLKHEWQVEKRWVEGLEEAGFKVILTSAKTGDHVENAFEHLGRLMLSDRSAMTSE